VVSNEGDKVVVTATAARNHDYRDGGRTYKKEENENHHNKIKDEERQKM
jgi:hypothetical protein